MRILQVTNFTGPQFGGPPQKILTLSRGLAQRGHEVHVATFRAEPHGSAEHRGFYEGDGVEVLRLPWIGKGLWQMPLNVRALARAVRRADVVHCYGLYNLLCPVAAWLALRSGRPYFLEPLGMYVPRARRMRAKAIYHRLFTSWMARRATKIVATAPNEIEELKSLVPAERIVLRRNGIDLSAFENLPDGAAFRAKHGIGPGERLVLYVGRISPIKNLEQLVEAFHEAFHEAAPATRLVLVGPLLEPDYEARLRALIARLGVSDRVSLAGPLYGEEKMAALAAADLFVLPSHYESFGNAAAEAVACGVPVLLTETCGVAPLIHARAGLAVPLGVAELARGLQIMINDNGQRDALTRQCAKVAEELSWEEPLAMTEQLYADAMRGNGSNAGSGAAGSGAQDDQGGTFGESMVARESGLSKGSSKTAFPGQ